MHSLAQSDVLARKTFAQCLFLPTKAKLTRYCETVKETTAAASKEALAATVPFTISQYLVSFALVGKGKAVSQGPQLTHDSRLGSLNT